MKTTKLLTNHTNKKFKINFRDYKVQYRVNKFLEDSYGKPDEDAYKFVKIAQKDI